MERRKTKKIMVGDVSIGGGSPITIQSMTNTDTKNIDDTVSQILRFESLGCDLSRSAINDMEDAKAIREIKEKTNIPFIADIQFHYKLAIAAVENGADCLRINPGNIGSKEKVKELVNCCNHYGVPMRVGVNSGSIHQNMLDKYGGVNVDSICYSALEEIEYLESLNFYNMKISLKSSDVNMSIGAYKRFSELSDYPLHLGITEAGPPFKGTIKSAVGIGSLLSQGIGDTLRVSLTSNPEEEIKVGKEILKALDLRQEGIDIISCPTCARTKIDLIRLVEQADELLDKMDKNIKVAIMGCPVNGPGEAKEADIGIAAGKGTGILFKKGVVLRKVPEEELLSALIEEIEQL